LNPTKIVSLLDNSKTITIPRLSRLNKISRKNLWELGLEQLMIFNKNQKVFHMTVKVKH